MDAKLFVGEELMDVPNIENPTCVTTDSAINEKYIRGEVRIVTEQARYPLSSVPSMVESSDYKLNPEFQRRHRWDDLKKSKLIESFIMNVPIPPIFLYEDHFSHYEVMDGLQRLTAISDFYRDRFALKDLGEWKELNGRRYSELPDVIKKGIDRRYLSSVILLQETAKTSSEALRLKQLVFERLNSGGVKLEPQESRNAVYNGPLNQLCIQMARDVHLCRLWNIPEPTPNELLTGDISTDLLENEDFRKMTDVELVLRFFAHRQRASQDKGTHRDYLDLFLKIGNKFPESVLSNYKTLFKKTTQLVWEVLGENAFFLYRKRKTGWNWFERPTTALFDPIMFAFSQKLESSDQLIDNATKIRESLPDFYKHNYSEFEGRHTNRSNVNTRKTLFGELLSSFINK